MSRKARCYVPTAVSSHTLSAREMLHQPAISVPSCYCMLNTQTSFLIAHPRARITQAGLGQQHYRPVPIQILAVCLVPRERASILKSSNHLGFSKRISGQMLPSVMFLPAADSWPLSRVRGLPLRTNLHARPRCRPQQDRHHHHEVHRAILPRRTLFEERV
jgi:hypothetical protein